MSNPHQKHINRSIFKRMLNGLLLIAISPIILIALCVLPAVLLYRVLYGLLLGLFVKILWHHRNKFICFIYSDSPNWKEYIESNILPKIKDESIVTNWSERSKLNWRNKPLELRIFLHWSRVKPYNGWRKWHGREYNPIAIIFRPWWNPKVLRFWDAFVEHKHGNDSQLKTLEDALFKYVS